MISLLPEFMDTCENKDIRVEEYLDFIVKKRSVASKEALGIRIHSMGMRISAIWEARNLEISTLKKSEKAFQPNSDKKDRKFPLLSQRKRSWTNVSALFLSALNRFPPYIRIFVASTLDLILKLQAQRMKAVRLTSHQSLLKVLTEYLIGCCSLIILKLRRERKSSQCFLCIH
ncbi:PREDICTED: LOW QUALITY PROTEIN uncharacterized [Prunus dulcis]|uniref:PREDICTED: LOW QUALITY PROTEIN uncharacterized n=1 Tax=Prunus dulcis TaxID=3755 RepID=A0A5E4FJE9_PRUDU|nr:PREDICTED: LOW QUALITY PROTEIN uncharacterized [Prunus dulcis]